MQIVIDIPDNATNGDVIKSLFPRIRFQQSSVSEFILAVDENNMIANTHYYLDWWNAPYELKVEIEENDDIDAMLEHLWNDTADEESEE